MSKFVIQSTLVYSIALILLGLIGYIITGMQSITALIPSFWGIIIILLVFMLTKRMNKPTILVWTLTVLGVIGFIATVNGIPKLLTLISGDNISRPSAAISQTIMAVLSLFYAISIALKNRKQNHR